MCLWWVWLLPQSSCLLFPKWLTQVSGLQHYKYYHTLLSISSCCTTVNNTCIYLVLTTAVSPVLIVSFQPNITEETAPTEAGGTTMFSLLRISSHSSQGYQFSSHCTWFCPPALLQIFPPHKYQYSLIPYYDISSLNVTYVSHFTM